MKPRWKLVALLIAPFLSIARGNTTSATECITDWIGDSLCDASQNNSECQYDGGDCCECDCENSDVECGCFGYNCVDPSADCYEAPAGEDAEAADGIGDPDGSVGTVVGGVVGGVLLAAAAIVLAVLVKSGRLKACKCCRSPDPTVIAPKCTTSALAVSTFSDIAASSVDSRHPPARPCPGGGSAAAAAVQEPVAVDSSPSPPRPPSPPPPPPPDLESVVLVQHPPGQHSHA